MSNNGPLGETEAATAGLVCVVVVNFSALELLTKLSASYIAEQKRIGTLVAVEGPTEPGTQGFSAFLTYRREIADILLAPIKSIDRKEHPNVMYRKFFTNQDKRKSRRYGRNRGRRSGSRDEGDINNDDMSDTGSVGTSYSVGSSYSNKSNRSTRSNKSSYSSKSSKSAKSYKGKKNGNWGKRGGIDTNIVSDRRFAVRIDGTGVTKKEWEVDSKAPPGGILKWWQAGNGKITTLFINFDTDENRQAYFKTHPSLPIRGGYRQVHLQN